MSARKNRRQLSQRRRLSHSASAYRPQRQRQSGRRGGYSRGMTGYADGTLPDAQIAAMSPAQRRDLIQRLERPLDEVFPPAIARRMRRNRLALMVGGAFGLIRGRFLPALQ